MKDLLGPSRPELVASKKPSDMALLAVLAAAAPDPEVEAIVKERMPLAQRKELGGQLPLLARVLGV